MDTNGFSEEVWKVLETFAFECPQQPQDQSILDIDAIPLNCCNEFMGTDVFTNSIQKHVHQWEKNLNARDTNSNVMSSQIEPNQCQLYSNHGHSSQSIPRNLSSVIRMESTHEETMNPLAYSSLSQLSQCEHNENNDDIEEFIQAIFSEEEGNQQIGFNESPDNAAANKNSIQMSNFFGYKKQKIAYDTQHYSIPRYNIQVTSMLANHRRSRLLQFHNLLVHSFNMRDINAIYEFINSYFYPGAHIAMAHGFDTDEDCCKSLSRHDFFQYVDVFNQAVIKGQGHLSRMNNRVIPVPHLGCEVVITRIQLKITLTVGEYFEFGSKYKTRPMSSFLDVMDTSKMSNRQIQQIREIEASENFLNQKYTITDVCYARTVISNDKQTLLSFTMANKLKSFF